MCARGEGHADRPADRAGRGKPHRADRAWVTAWSPEQISNRLWINFPDDALI